MATSAAPRGKSIDVLLLDEATFGTPAVGDYYRTLVYEDSLEDLAPLEADPILGTARDNARDSTEPAPGLPDGVTGNLVVPLDLNHFWYWLRGAFGDPVTTGAATDFAHTFRSGNEVLPHRTIERKTSSDVFLQRTGMLVNTLAFDASRKTGYDRVTVGMLGRKEAKLAATGGGAPAAILARDPVPAFLPIFKKDGVSSFATGLMILISSPRISRFRMTLESFCRRKSRSSFGSSSHQ